ncbi:MAG: hypothetical protein DMG10_28750 [Acidobacteria bacterium]|nr:MAG: hypothetical protein DMG10_28750 [Acidobacteriota bacterium]
MKSRWPQHIPASEIEKEFLLAAVHLKSRSSFLTESIASRNRPGSSPMTFMGEVFVRDMDDRTAILEKVPTEAAKLNAITRYREELAAAYPACRFPVLDYGVLVGIQVEGKTLLAEAPTFWQAYGKLRRRMFWKLP